MWPFDLPAKEALRLKGETVIEWAAFDPDWHRMSYPGATRSLAGRPGREVLAFYLEHGQGLGHSPNRYFDEAWHRKSYASIVEAIEQGKFSSAFDSYCRAGNLDRSPHWLFDEMYYRRRQADLTDTVLQQADLINGYDHFLRHGNREGRIGHPLFDPFYYLDRLPQEERAAAAEMGPYQHYLMTLDQGAADRETSRYFACAWFLQRYPDIADAVVRGDRRSALEHYLCNDTPTAFDPLPDFSEEWYLNGHAGLREAIEAGTNRNGYAHFLRHGTNELRSPAPHIDLRWYAAREPVKDSLLRHEADDAFSHWLTIGKPNGFDPAPPRDEQITDAQAMSLLRQGAAAMLPAFARNPLKFQCKGDPDLSVVAVVKGELAETMATLASLRNNWHGDIDLVLIVIGFAPDASDIARFVAGATIQRFDDAIDVNAGFVAGLACARAAYALCLGAATELAPGAIEAALRRLHSDPAIGAVGGKVLRPNGLLGSAGHVVWRDGGSHAYARDESPLVPEANFVRDVHFCSSAFLLMRSATFAALQDTGALPPADDHAAADVCLRMARAGQRIVYDPAVVVRAWTDRDPGRNARVDSTIHAAFLALCHEPDGRVLVSARHANSSRGRVLFIEDTVPLRNIGSGFVRANDLVATMAALGYAVTVFPVNGCRFGLGAVYADMPDTVEVMYDHNLTRLAEFLRLRRGVYDTIWVSRTHNLDRLRQILDRVFTDDSSPPTVVLDTEAVSSVRAASLAALKGEEFDLQAAVRREFANAERCRSVIAVSDYEAALLRDHGCADVRTIGHMRPLRPTPRPFKRRAGMLFAGAIHQMDSPNYDGLCWFADAVLPVVEQALGWETRLTIAGYIAPEVSLDRFRGHPRITLRGPVTDLEPLYAAHRMFVAPTRFAAGSPYKVHEAASFGLPVVATALLRHQLGWTDGQELLSAEASDPAGFAAKILALYRDEYLWSRLRVAALDRLGRENDAGRYAEVVDAALRGGRAEASQN